MPVDEETAGAPGGTEGRILTFIRAELVGPDTELGLDDDLLSGVLDSVAALRLATWVANEFEIEILPSDYVIENFRSVRAVADYVRRAGER